MIRYLYLLTSLSIISISPPLQAHCSKRLHTQHEVSNKKRRITATKWSLAQLLTAMYRISKTDKYEPQDILPRLIREIFTHIADRNGITYSKTHLVIPDPQFPLESLDLLITAQEKDDSLMIRIYHGELPHLEQIICTYQFFIGGKKVRREISAGQGFNKGHRLLLEIESLMASLMPLHIDPAHRLSLPLTENYLDEHEFKQLCEEHKNRPLIDKLMVLNNGPIGNTNELPLWIRLKGGDEKLRIGVKVGKYRSNCLSLANFSDGGDLLFYKVNLIAWNKGSKEENSRSTVFLQFPLDQGYGSEHLPAELIWMERLPNLSGKELLTFINSIVDFLKPKAIYLLDSAAVADAQLRMLRPIWQGQGFYQQYGGYKVLDTHSLIDHKGNIYDQSNQAYADCIQYLNNFPAQKLPSVFQRHYQDEVKNLLNRYDTNTHTTFRELLTITSKEGREGDLFFLCQMFFSEKYQGTVKQGRFFDCLEVLSSTQLLHRTTKEPT